MPRSSQRRAKRWWLVVPAVLIVGAATWLGVVSAGGSSTTGAQTRTFTVTRGPLDQTVTAQGTVAPPAQPT